MRAPDWTALSYGAKFLREGLPPPTCHLACVMFHLSHVMCHVSCVKCHMSHVTRDREETNTTGCLCILSFVFSEIFDESFHESVFSSSFELENMFM